MQKFIEKLNQPNLVGLILNITLAVVTVLVINAFVFGYGFDDSGVIPKREISFAPSGEFVGTVWLVLFLVMGIARWLLNFAGKSADFPKKLIVVILILCAAYPLYTLGLSNDLLGFIGNLLVIAVTFYTITQAVNFSKTASVLLSSIILWVSFATILILAENGYIL